MNILIKRVSTNRIHLNSFYNIEKFNFATERQKFSTRHPTNRSKIINTTFKLKEMPDFKNLPKNKKNRVKLKYQQIRIPLHIKPER